MATVGNVVKQGLHNFNYLRNMNMNFSTSAYLAKKKKFIPRTFNIEGIDFEMIALTDEYKAKVEECETYEDMIFAAADYGLSAEGSRAMDDEELTMILCELWLEDELQIECEPSVKHQVGEKVCAISGLTEFTEAKKLEEEELIQMEKEEAAAAEVDAEIEALNADQVVCGDNLSPEQLRADAAAFQAA